MLNRRDLFRSLLGAAVASCVRWLPMPEKPAVKAPRMTLAEAAKRIDPDAFAKKVIALMARDPRLDGLKFLPALPGAGHRYEIKAKMPPVPAGWDGDGA